MSYKWSGMVTLDEESARMLSLVCSEELNMSSGGGQKRDGLLLLNLTARTPGQLSLWKRALTTEKSAGGFLPDVF